MARIDSRVLDRLMSKLGVSRSRAYQLIDAKGRSSHLPRHLAALALAAERGISISRYASAEDLAIMRQAAVSAAPRPVIVEASPRTSESGQSRKRTKTSGRGAERRGTTVFVVHGRDVGARDSVFAFLRAIGLHPLEWVQATRLVRKGSPYVGEILEAAFGKAAAVVVLLTPDDEARLRRDLRSTSDPAYEKSLRGQARANVLFEAGMAFGKDANSTVLVQVGEVRPFSDIGGRHVVHLSNQASSRQDFVTKLANAGCNVDTSGSDWLTAGDFEGRGRTRGRSPRRRRRSRRGRRR